MFFDIGSLEFLTLIVMAILLFGPDKLPKMIQDVARFIQKVRAYSENAKRDIRAELGPEFKDFEFQDLNPRTFAKKHLIDGDQLGLQELRESLDVRKELTEVTDAVNGHGRPALPATDAPAADAPVDLAKPGAAPATGTDTGARLEKDGDGPVNGERRPPFDLDAT